MKQQNRKVSVHNDKSEEITIGFLLDFKTINNSVHAIVEVTGGNIISAKIENVHFVNTRAKRFKNIIEKQEESINSISYKQIMQVVEFHTKVKCDVIMGQERLRNAVNARFIFIALCSKFRKSDTQKKIGSYLDNRDHSSINHAKKMHEIYMRYDEYKELYNRCENEIFAII